MDVPAIVNDITTFWIADALDALFHSGSDIFSKQIPTPLLKLLEDCKDAHPATSWNYCGDVEMKQPYQLPEWRLGAPTKGMDNNCLGMPTSLKKKVVNNTNKV